MRDQLGQDKPDWLASPLCDRDAPEIENRDKNFMSKSRGIVGGLLMRDGRMLLGRRSPTKKAWPDTWDMPGGHVEKGESFEEALLREIDEEIGVVPLRFALIADYTLDGGEAYRIFRVDAWSGGEPNLRNHEHTELRWVTPAEACALRPLALDRYVDLFETVGKLIGSR